MKLKLIKKIEILAATFSISYNTEHDGGHFSMATSSIEIGIKQLDKDALYVFSTISHEVMEVIFCMMSMRYDNGRLDGNYLFNFNHQQFENAIQLHAQAMIKFLNQ